MENTDRSTNNRMVLLLIAGIPVTIILSATWLWYFVVQGDLDLVGALGTANRGVLLQPPRQIDEVELLDPDGVRFRNADLDPRWAMLVPGAGGVCDTSCEQSLYVTRQIHTALGKEYNRIRRLYVSGSAPGDTSLKVTELSDQRPAPASFSALLEDEHRGVKPLVLSPGQPDTLFVEYQSEPSTWYLVDPSGWIMMSYDSSIPYKDVIADLKFLLKNSGD